jgi:hypothetical protein
MAFQFQHEETLLVSCRFLRLDSFSPESTMDKFLAGLTFLAYGQSQLAFAEFSRVSNGSEMDFKWSGSFCEKALIVQVTYS